VSHTVSPKPPEISRLVALGASNLTLGFSAVLGAARQAFGAEVEVLAALGYGRSYGSSSTVLIRTLPGILQSGLWRELDRRPGVPTRAVIADVGNDILYGFTPAQILGWVKEAVERLRGHTTDIALTNLPSVSIKRLSPAAFLFFRSVFFPPSRVLRDQAFERVDEVNAGLEALASAMELRLIRLDPAWYGLDPIHIRPRYWPIAWRRIVAGDSEDASGFSMRELARLHLLPPERRFLAGVEQIAPQSGRKLRRGGRLWIY